MRKEPGENPSEKSAEELKKQETKANIYVLAETLDKIEEDEIVDLNKPYGKMGITMGTALKLIVENIKNGLDNFTWEERSVADTLIIKAEIYLAAHGPKKKR
jgi:hypothetical protein